MQLQVFISYRHNDTEFPLKLLNYLREAGHKTWIDAENIRAGWSWDREITEAIRSSDAVLGILTPESIKSDNVLDEWACALANDIPLILLLARPVAEREIPHRYIRLQYIDFTQNPEWAYTRLGDSLKSIAETARSNRVYEKVTQPPDEQKAVSRWNLKKIRTIPYHLSAVQNFFIDSKGWLWISDSQQIRRFNTLDQTIRDTNWILPKQNWKIFFTSTSLGAIFGTDWDGGLYVFDEQSKGSGRALHTARYDDVPIHLVTVNDNLAPPTIAAASWNGEIHYWEETGKAIFPKGSVKLAHLPTQILLLASRHLATCDETGQLRIYDPLGNQLYSWSASGSSNQIDHMWADVQPAETLSGRIFALLNRKTLVKIDIPSMQAETIEFACPVVSLSHQQYDEAESWTCAGLEGGTVEWVSLSQFRIVDAKRVELGFEIQRLSAVYDPQNPNCTLAVGLSKDGQFFSLQETDCHLFSTESIHRLVLDETGRFVYWLLPGKIEIYRNPVIEPYPCKVSLTRIEGTLQVGAYCELSMTLTNDGKIPISKIYALLIGEGKIEESASELELHLAPGESVQLNFSVRALVQGTSVPLELHVEMDDEAGPPSTEQNIRCSVKSEK